MLPALRSIAAVYREGGWPAEAEGDTFTAPYSAPSARATVWAAAGRVRIVGT
jgi:hypothetical protein